MTESKDLLFAELGKGVCVCDESCWACVCHDVRDYEFSNYSTAFILVRLLSCLP